MEVEGGSALHPLMVTSKPHKLEDSMDMSVDAEKRVGEEEEAQRVFGMPTVGTQGPAGSRVPDLDEPMRRRRQHPQFEEEDEDERPWGEGVDPSDPDAPLDAVGPHPAVDAEMTAEDFAFDPGADAAAAAVVAARHAGCSGSAALMDALEAAEDAFEQQQDTKVAAVQRQKQARLESPRKAGTSGTAGSAAKMQIFARNDVVAKSRFWYFLARMKKVKKTNGEILHLQNVTEKTFDKVRTYAIWLRFTSRSGIHNMYKEFRATSLIDAVNSMYSEMASHHKAKFFSIQIIKTVELTDEEQIKRPYARQFLDNDVKFPVIRSKLHLDRQEKTTFSYTIPSFRD